MWSDSDDDIVPVLFSFIEACERNEVRNREWWVHPYNKKRDEEDVIKNLMVELRKYPVKFKNFIKMEIETFDYLLALIGESITKQNTNYRKSISPGERLFITLRYITTGESFKSLSHHFRCGASTIDKIVTETCNVIWETLSPIYLPKPDVKKWTSIADAFGKMWNFPNCLGAISGKDIRMKCPPKTGSDYYKYKELRSIHLQAVVDAHGQFVYVDVGFFGRNSNSSVLKHSDFGKQLINKELNLPYKQELCLDSNEYFPFVFVAERNYPLLTNVMRPFAPKNLTNERKIYNYRLTRAHRVVECAFSMLTKKFNIFDTIILLSPNKVQMITLAACALHNMIRKREGLLQEIYTEQEAMEGVDEGKSNKYIQIERPSNVARVIRNQFVSYFNSTTGSIPGQFHHLQRPVSVNND